MKPIYKLSDKEFINKMSNYTTDSNNDTNSGGVNFHTHHQYQPELYHWEKSMGVFHDPEAKAKDEYRGFKTVDLTKHVSVPGMPLANHNHNTHCDEGSY